MINMIGSLLPPLPDFSAVSWWISQIGPIILLVCLIVSMQQRTRKNIMWWNTVGMFVAFVFTFWLGVIPVIILIGINLARNIAVLVFAHFEKVDSRIQWLVGALLVLVLIVANVVFWQGLLSVGAIFVGTGLIIGFFQPTPKRMRIVLAIMRPPSATFHLWSGNWTQVVTELAVMVSGIIGIIRFDIKKSDGQVPSNDRCVEGTELEN